jgi:hypothetical protein
MRRGQSSDWQDLQKRTPGFARFAETFSGRLKRAGFAEVQADNSRYFFRGRR